MNTIKRTFITLMVGVAMVNMANAQSWQDIFKGGGGNSGSNGGNVITNILEGVFSSSNITVADLAGQWQSNGPAVCFKSDNFLKKAGGIAAAGMVESKLAPYYQQYGLNNAVVTITQDGNFTISVKGIKLKGTITPSTEGKGVFEFNFTALGSISLGKVTTYAQKTSSTMDLMFDATKLKNLISKVAQYTGISLAKTLSSLLDSYEGLCVGFRLSQTGPAPGSGTATSGNSSIFDILGLGGSGNRTTTGSGVNNGNNTSTQTGTQTGAQSGTQSGKVANEEPVKEENKNSQQGDSTSSQSGLQQLLNILGGAKRK